MGRMYSRKRGKSGSTKPTKNKQPSWVRYKDKEVELLIVELAKEEKTPSQIGLILRDIYGIAYVKQIAGKRITKVLTAAVDGVPLATMVANALGVNIVTAKSTKEVGVSSFIEETCVLDGSGFTVTLYVPKSHVAKDKKGKTIRELTLKRNDSVLVVDDIIRSGTIQTALLNLVRQSKAEVSGIFALITVGNSWKKKMQIPNNCPVEIILES